MGKNFKKNKYEKMAMPEAQFDFHELGILMNEEIVFETEQFIKNCAENGMKKVLIITGKGLHSENGPVVRPIVMKTLSTLTEVKSVAAAKIDMGGSGALVIDLY
ncbi:MAG: Smr protein/MutS2 [Candidatus Peregrinibacteria bacterium GW2011_GWA2_33_10]|nr:MAG: Smr protein/MutS2 [Candidatus Peregrinibacteria bacterium GW2011_GWA2_33_10]KKP39541.1 MAG: hypothetical protein UR30_C0010G0037 [Candidatus Peregrinibacteria bacterium GW2011_GWC2_33_13]OGJ48893.1 MAG: hypothetical protein A2229_00520 [Candidatus Peregrinibacteria bacterium RIFOXYA2_FULL_33_7]